MKLLGGLFLDSENDDIITTNSDSSGTLLDGFLGIFDLIEEFLLEIYQKRKFDDFENAII